MLIARFVECPYCGESFETELDLSAGSQQYVEDCYVCCRPIEFRVEVDAEGELAGLTLLRDDE
jgi:transcription elongation factor Elf1